MLFLDYEKVNKKVNKKVQKKRKIKIIYKILKRKKRSFDFTKSSYIISIIKSELNTVNVILPQGIASCF